MLLTVFTENCDQFITENNTALGIAIYFNIILSKYVTQPVFTFLLFVYWQPFYCCSVFNVKSEVRDQVLNSLHTNTLSPLAAVIWEAAVIQWIQCMLLNF
jgi:hypothetical protein